MAGLAAEETVLEVREALAAQGLFPMLLGFLLLGIPFLGRQRVVITTQRINLTQGFWTKLRDDVEIFRIRDVVVKQSLWQRLWGIGDIVVKSTEGRAEEIHILKGLPNPIKVSETLRDIWNRTARPQGPATLLD